MIGDAHADFCTSDIDLTILRSKRKGLSSIAWIDSAGVVRHLCLSSEDAHAMQVGSTTSKAKQVERTLEEWVTLVCSEWGFPDSFVLHELAKRWRLYGSPDWGNLQAYLGFLQSTQPMPDHICPTCRQPKSRMTIVARTEAQLQHARVLLGELLSEA